MRFIWNIIRFYGIEYLFRNFFNIIMIKIKLNEIVKFCGVHEQFDEYLKEYPIRLHHAKNAIDCYEKGMITRMLFHLKNIFPGFRI